MERHGLFLPIETWVNSTGSLARQVVDVYIITYIRGYM